jgi:hypothetical protein
MQQRESTSQSGSTLMRWHLDEAGGLLHQKDGNKENHEKPSLEHLDVNTSQFEHLNLGHLKLYTST